MPALSSYCTNEFYYSSKLRQNIYSNLQDIKANYLYPSENARNRVNNIEYITDIYEKFANSFAICQNCKKISIWLNEKMIYPKPRLTTPPNEDLPEEIKADYEEASLIVQDSPRGACALLRLALQKLMIHLGEDKNLDKVIKSLMEENIDEDLRKALDSVRVIGNSAVHPNELEIKDKPEIAIKLFKLINFIAKEVITNRKEIREFYSENIPETAKR